MCRSKPPEKRFEWGVPDTVLGYAGRNQDWEVEIRPITLMNRPPESRWENQKKERVKGGK